MSKPTYQTMFNHLLSYLRTIAKRFEMLDTTQKERIYAELPQEGKETN
jgi:hypothetical protein